MTDSILLRPEGDVELWLVEPADCAWRLPVHVEWKKDSATGHLYGLVLPGCCFYQVQLLAVHAILGKRSLDERTDRWLLQRHDLEALLRKAPGIHAEFYYDWRFNESKEPAIPSHHGMNLPMRRIPTDDASTFASFVSGEYGIPVDVVKVVLMAVSRAGTKWMVKHHRKIDLGFVQLMAVPFRANWKEIIMFKGKSNDLLKALLRPKIDRLRRLAAMRFPATLCSPHNIALWGGVSHARIDYTIEAMTTAVFSRAVDEIEGERYARSNYVERYGKVIKTLYGSIVDCLADYAKKTQQAWAAVHNGSNGGGPTFVPAKPKTVNGVHLDDLPVDIIPTGNDFSVFAEREGTSQRIPLPSPDHPGVQTLPAVLPAAHDLRTRSGNGNVDKPRPGGAAGVPLLDAGQGADSGQPVFSCGSTETWCPPRMDP